MWNDAIRDRDYWLEKPSALLTILSIPKYQWESTRTTHYCEQLWQFHFSESSLISRTMPWHASGEFHTIFPLVSIYCSWAIKPPQLDEEIYQNCLSDALHDLHVGHGVHAVQHGLTFYWLSSPFCANPYHRCLCMDVRSCPNHIHWRTSFLTQLFITRKNPIFTPEFRTCPLPVFHAV